MSASPATDPLTLLVVDVIDTESSRRPLRSRSRAAIAIVLIAGAVVAVVLTHHGGGPHRSTSVSGPLTATQYAAAQGVMHGWASQKGIQVSTAFAFMQPTKSQFLTSCPLVVTLVGRNARAVPHFTPHS